MNRFLVFCVFGSLVAMTCGQMFGGEMLGSFGGFDGYGLGGFGGEVPLLSQEELASIMAQQGGGGEGGEGGEGPSEEGGSEGGPSNEEGGGYDGGPSRGPSEEGNYSPEEESRSGPAEESYRQDAPNYGPPPGYSSRDDPHYQPRREYQYQGEINHAVEPSNTYKSGFQYYQPETAQPKQKSSAGYIQDGRRESQAVNDGRSGRVHVYGHYNVANNNEQPSGALPPVSAVTTGSGYRAPAREYQNAAAPVPEIIYGRRMTVNSEKSVDNPTGNPTHNGKYIIQK